MEEGLLGLHHDGRGDGHGGTRHHSADRDLHSTQSVSPTHNNRRYPSHTARHHTTLTGSTARAATRAASLTPGGGTTRAMRTRPARLCSSGSASVRMAARRSSGRGEAEALSEAGSAGGNGGSGRHLHNAHSINWVKELPQQANRVAVVVPLTLQQ